MILKASQRGGGMQLAAHLLKAENEHVEVHEVRGFVADDLRGAIKEAEAVAKGTRCKQHLFSVSLSPPETAVVGNEAFDHALDRIEQSTGLTGQPRIIVYHEKESRRHCHAVWSRIDADTMIARPLPFFKMKLREISKGLYLQHGWKLPRGFVDSRQRDPQNYTLKEWQEAKRAGDDPNMMKTLVRECWTSTSSRQSFVDALAQRGLFVAKGDRREYVIGGLNGSVRALPRLIGKKVSDVAARLEGATPLPAIADARRTLTGIITPRLIRLIDEAKHRRKAALVPLNVRRVAMRDAHVAERQRLDCFHQSRSTTEAKERASRMRGGVMGVWDRLTGRHGRTVSENEAATLIAKRRDRAERDAMVSAQLAERRDLQRAILAVRREYEAVALGLHRDLGRNPSESRGAEIRSIVRGRTPRRGLDLGR